MVCVSICKSGLGGSSPGIGLAVVVQQFLHRGLRRRLSSPERLEGCKDEIIDMLRGVERSEKIKLRAF